MNAKKRTSKLHHYWHVYPIWTLDMFSSLCTLSETFPNCCSSWKHLSIGLIVDFFKKNSLTDIEKQWTVNGWVFIEKNVKEHSSGRKWSINGTSTTSRTLGSYWGRIFSSFVNSIGVLEFSDRFWNISRFSAALIGLFNGYTLLWSCLNM